MALLVVKQEKKEEKKAVAVFDPDAWRLLGKNDYMSMDQLDAFIQVTTAIKPEKQLELKFHFILHAAVPWDALLTNLRAPTQRGSSLLEKEQAILCAPISVRADGDYVGRKHGIGNNHWALMIFDTTRESQRSARETGLVTFWDPYGTPMQLPGMAKALRDRFPDFGVQILEERLQTDCHQCGIWVAECIRRYLAWAGARVVAGQPFSMSRASVYSVLPPSPTRPSPMDLMLNTRFSELSRERARERLLTVPAIDPARVLRNWFTS